MILRDGVAPSLSEFVMLSTIMLKACAVSPSGSAIILCTPSSPPLTIPGSNGKDPKYGPEVDMLEIKERQDIADRI